MTEAEWLTCYDLALMLRLLSGNSSERKKRLFMCACCRRIWHLLTDARSRRAVEIAEQFADGLASENELALANHAADFADGRTFTKSARSIWGAVHATDDMPISYDSLIRTAYELPNFRKHETIVRYIRDIFGNPFRPVTLDPAWQTATVVALAEAIYAERAFNRMPILADALEEAGCTSADILDHCRQPGEHVRGCWVVDLMLGKS